WPNHTVLNMPISCVNNIWYLTAGTEGTNHVGQFNDHAIDLAISGDSTGQSIYAAHDGRVRSSGWETTEEGYGYDLSLWIGASTTYFTQYAHLKEMSTFNAHTPVYAGHPIAQVGATGYGAAGAHLHFTLAEITQSSWR